MKKGRPKLKLSMSEAQLEELRSIRRQTRDAGVRERCQALIVAHGGQHTYQEIADLLGRSKKTIQNWVAAFCAGSMDALASKRGQGGGRPTPLSGEEIQRQITEGLKEGRWQTGVEVQAWLRNEHGLERSLTSVYHLLGKLGGALKVPRPVHVKKDPAAEAEFKEHLQEKLEALGLPHDRPVRVWVQDEGRYGLHSVVRRCWGLRGTRIHKPSQKKYEWGYMFGALEVVEGHAEFMFLPTVNLGMSELFLRQIAASDPEAEHVVIWDQAGFHHRPGDAQLPGRIHLLPLPPYCPELNPVERLWDVVKDKVANKVYDTLDRIEEELAEGLKRFIERRDAVLDLVGDGWLHQKANISHPADVVI
jgi:transposase